MANWIFWMVLGLPGTDLPANCEAIRAAALAPNQSQAGRPLPLFASWNVGGPKGEGFSPAWQWKMIEDGHRLLPWFPLQNPSAELSDADAAVFAVLARHRLPFAFVSTQWEHLLSSDKRYASIPGDQNPNVVKASGEIERRVSPFGPIEAWREVGGKWGATQALATAARIYPNPEKILFLSNNEHNKLVWTKVDDDRRFMEKNPGPQTDEAKRRIVGDGWIERYRTLQSGLRAQLPSDPWRSAARFVGYNAFGQETMGRWPNWPRYSLHSPGRISPWPEAWDGGAPSFYTNNWEIATDYTVFSPQVQCMNWLFMLEDAHKINPEFWFEMSLWDGRTPKKANDKLRYYADRGQTYSPQRYAGLAQFGLWLLRPRVVREFRGYLETRADYEAHTQAVMAGVDAVHDTPVLAEFWKLASLVPNPARKHPWEIGLPESVEKRERWFLLDCDRHPTGKWKLQTELKVLAIALVKGEAPNRRWLVYAHAPLGDEANVQVTIPGYKPVGIDVSVGGNFTLVEEATGAVTRVSVQTRGNSK